jgi:hypothetical protein
MSLSPHVKPSDSVRAMLGLTLVIATAACSTEPKHSNSMMDGTGQLAGTGGNVMMTTQAPVGAGAGGSASTGTQGTGGTMSGGGAHPGTGPTGMGSGGQGSSMEAKDASIASSGDGATTPPEQDSGAMPAMHEDLGMGNGSDVVLLGDSWMSNTLQIEGTGGGIAPSLIQVSGQPYTNYGVQGVMLLMADAFGPAIPTQYESAKQFQPGIKTVVMTGGGNDVIQNPTLQASCMMNGPECKQLRLDIIDALDKLWSEMSDDGVQDVIYIRYSMAASSSMNSSMTDAGAPPPPPQVCLKGPIRCHSVDTTDLVAATDLAADGIHPLVTANQAIAQRVFDLMTKEGMRR